MPWRSLLSLQLCTGVRVITRRATRGGSTLIVSNCQLQLRFFLSNCFKHRERGREVVHMGVEGGGGYRDSGGVGVRVGTGSVWCETLVTGSCV